MSGAILTIFRPAYMSREDSLQQVLRCLSVVSLPERGQPIRPLRAHLHCHTRIVVVTAKAWFAGQSASDSLVGPSPHLNVTFVPLISGQMLLDSMLTVNGSTYRARGLLSVLPGQTQLPLPTNVSSKSNLKCTETKSDWWLL